LLSYERLSWKPSIFKSFSSLGVHEFDALYAKVEAAYPAFEEKRLYRVDRKRRVGAGHPFKLPLRDRLLMLLMYYRLYVTSTLLGFLFDGAEEASKQRISRANRKHSTRNFEKRG